MSQSAEINAGSQYRIRANYYVFAKSLKFLERLSRLTHLAAASKALWISLAAVAILIPIGFKIDSALGPCLITWFVAAVAVSLVYMLLISQIRMLEKIIFLFFAGFFGFIVATPGFTVSLQYPLRYHQMGFIMGSVIAYLILNLFAKRRLNMIAPDPFRISYLREVYLPLFDKTAADQKQPLQFSAFSFEGIGNRKGDFASGRYALEHAEQLFSSEWAINEQSAVQLRHVHLRSDIYKYRKNKYKGSFHEDIVEVVVNSPRVKEKEFQQAVKSKINMLNSPGVEVSSKFEGDKAKLKLVKVSKLKQGTDLKKLDVLVVIPASTVHQLLSGITQNLH